MIEINLLPEEIKVKQSAKMVIFSFGKYLLYIIPVVIGFLALAHIYLAVLGGVKVSQFQALNKKWQGLSQQKKDLENFFKEYVLVSEDTRFLQQLLTQRLNWSEKLNKLSLNLPSGIWFNELTVSSKGLLIDGSAVSLQKEEIALVRKFIDALKSDTGFFKDFVSLELGRVQTRSIAGYDIFDFVLIGTLKTK